jgi:hypothetical protein
MIKRYSMPNLATDAAVADGALIINKPQGKPEGLIF